jgi:hypothetical protein
MKQIFVDSMLRLNRGLQTIACVRGWSGYFFGQQKSLSVKPDPAGLPAGERPKKEA